MTGFLNEFRGNPPAKAQEIEEFERDSGVHLPVEYVSFLRTHDGGEGFIGRSSYVIFWKLSDITSLNSAYEVDKYAHGLLIFGSDGGGEAFAFDYRDPSHPIVSVPFVGMEHELIRRVAANFDEFLIALAKVPS